MFGIIFALGLVGNLLVILVVLADKKMRNATNILILSLAVADLLFLVFCLPFSAVHYATTTWPFSSVVCKFVNYTLYCSLYASVYNLVLMALARYVAVAHPMRSKRILRRRNAWLATAFIWSVILSGNLPLLFQYDVLPYQYYGENRSTCLNMEHRASPQTGKLFHVSFLVFSYMLPLTVVCIMYSLTARILLCGHVPGNSQSQESVRVKQRVTRMLIIVVIVFGVCWLPIQMILILQKYIKYEYSVPLAWLQVASNCLSYMNSCVNPILYALLSVTFREKFKNILCCSSLRLRRQQGSANPVDRPTYEIRRITSMQDD